METAQFDTLVRGKSQGGGFCYGSIKSLKPIHKHNPDGTRDVIRVETESGEIPNEIKALYPHRFQDPQPQAIDLLRLYAMSVCTLARGSFESLPTEQLVLAMHAAKVPVKSFEEFSYGLNQPQATEGPREEDRAANSEERGSPKEST